MNNTFVAIAAWVLFILGVVGVVAQAMIVGASATATKDKQTEGCVGFVLAAFRLFLMVCVCGRVLGWF